MKKRGIICPACEKFIQTPGHFMHIPKCTGKKKRKKKRENQKGIYFIKCNSYVKIGYSIDLSKRIRNIQMGNPYPLRLLLVLDGNHAKEFSLHYRFRKYRIRGEWFKLSPRIIEFIKEMKNKESVSLPLSKKINPL